ncbi:MAG: ABC-2 family transporter protein, partial [Chloroflexota bacterium]|nr:ABC-2 family transporter protein [Chloroflexota bacterium]
MQQLGYTLDIYRRLINVQVRSQLQYRASFLLDVMATMLTLSMFFVSLALVFQRFGTLAGWTLGQVAFLWGMVEIAFGVMDMIFSGFDPAAFGQRVRRGTFDQLLLRPLNITVQVLGDEFLLRRLGRIAQGVVIFALALSLADIQWTLGKLVYLPCVLIGLVCFFGALFIAGATLTFWTIESIEAINILTYGGTEMMAYPMHIYPDWLRRFFTSLVPASFLNYYPALYFLDKPDPFGLPPILRFVAPLVGIGLLAAALAFWRFG